MSLKLDDKLIKLKVSKDDVISIEKLSDDAGKKIKLTEVLIISDKGKPIIGDPLIKGASVEAEIVDHARNAKVTVFKKKEDITTEEKRVIDKILQILKF